MATSERKHRGSLSLGSLELALEAEEQLFGELVKLEALGGMTVATHDDASFPTLSSLALLPQIGGMPAPAPHHAAPLFDGAATILGMEIGVSVFRTQ